MTGFSLLFSGGLAAALTAFSLGIWRAVVSLAGGSSGPLWRWVLVEEGLFLLLLFIGAWWVRIVLGLGKMVRTPQHYGTAAVFASVFSLLWCWYGLMVVPAMDAGLHPLEGWEWPFLTWGLPFALASWLLPAAGLLVQLGFAIGLGALALMVLGRAWAGR